MISSIYTTQMYSTPSQAARKGIAGLVTGLNTDEIIQQMTLATRSRIAQIMQKQTRAGWKQEAYQSVTSQLLNFKNSFMSALSTTNLRNASFYQSAIFTAKGENAGKVSATGTKSAAMENFSIKSITSLATAASFTSGIRASQTDATGKSVIKSDDITSYIASGIDISKMEGEAINIKLNGVNYNIALKNIETSINGADNAKMIVASINRGIEEAGLSGKIRAGLAGDRVELKLLTNDGSIVDIENMGSNIESIIGFKKGSSINERTPLIAEKNIAANPLVTYDNTSFRNALSGKTVTFNLDGVNRAITFNASEFGDYNNFATATNVAKYLSDKLGAAFGTTTVNGTPPENKVSVAAVDGRLVFSVADKTSTLSVANGDNKVIGYDGSKGVLGISFGDANRLLMSETLSKVNFNDAAKALFQSSSFLSGNGSAVMTINGAQFAVYKNLIMVNDGKSGLKIHEFKTGTTMRDVINTVNNANVGARIQYNSTTDNFSVIATETGSMGEVAVGGALGKALFGDMVEFGSNVSSVKASGQGNVAAELNATVLSSFLSGGQSVLSGQKMTFQFPDNTKYEITLGDVELTNNRSANAARIVDAINDALAAAENLTTNAITDITGSLKASVVDGKIQIGVDAGFSGGMRLVDAGDKIKSALGFATSDSNAITAGAAFAGTKDIVNNAANGAAISKWNDYSLTFNLNGVSHTINFGDGIAFDDGNPANAYLGRDRLFDDYLTGPQGSERYGFLKRELDKAFGAGAIQIAISGNDITFTAADTNAFLGITERGAQLLFASGASTDNRINMNAALTDANLNSVAAGRAAAITAATPEIINVNGTDFNIFNDKVEWTINGVTKSISSTHVSVNMILQAINEADVGAKVEYDKVADRFNVLDTKGNGVTITGAFGEALFGTNITPLEANYKKGADAQMKVSFDGGLTTTDITRSTNTFNLNGMNLTINETFAEGTGDITFSVKSDTDPIFNAIKEMIDSYNELIAKVNKELSTKPDRKFQPLTDEQRKEMSKEEIEMWEAKAKEGLLFGDDILRALASDIRFAFTTQVGSYTLSQIGITVSSDWRENGRLVIDEAKLRAAIENDADRVADIFTRTTTGTVSTMSMDAGILTRFDFVLNKYTNTVGTIKGSLIERAGHESSALSLVNNTLYRERAAYDKQIQALQAKLFREEQRYIKQFTALEKYIAQMQQQSMWFMDAFSTDY